METLAYWFCSNLLSWSTGIAKLLGGEGDEDEDDPVFPGNNVWKKDVAELENASIKVQLIYDKTLFMLHSHLPDSLWDAWIGVPYSIISSLYKGNNDSGTIFQKWIQSPTGWKCIGCERHCLESTEPPQDVNAANHGRQYKFHNGIRQSMVLQALIWSMYENTVLFKPFLGDEPFLTMMICIRYPLISFQLILMNSTLLSGLSHVKNTKIRIYESFRNGFPHLILSLNGMVA